MNLTSKQIEGMQAGRELDALVAVYVMEWRGEEEETFWPNKEWVWRNAEGLNMYSSGDFSTKDETALNVLSMFNQYEIRRNYNDYVVVLNPYHISGRAQGVGEAKTLALAISRAALKAKLMEVKHGR